jgi:translation initiation factor eIF-2B subunit delta
MRRPSSQALISPSMSFQDRLLPGSGHKDDAQDKFEQKQKRPSKTPPKIDEIPAPKPKMSKAERRELQEKQRAEKSARVAAGLPAKPKPMPKPASPQITETKPATKAKPTKVKKNEDIESNSSKTVVLFSHLKQYRSLDNEVLMEKLSKGNIHPVIVSLGVQYFEKVISGGNARCMAMLIALNKVISDFVTPSGTSIQRSLLQHIGKQVDYLANTRSLAPSMKTAVRFLKSKITSLDGSLPDEDVFVD